jgi:hypothetical protein
MKTKVALSCCALMACGGSNGGAPAPNRAGSTHFTYGSPKPATSSQLATVRQELIPLSAGGTVSGLAAVELADLAILTDSFFGSSNGGLADGPSPRLSKPRRELSDTTCVQETQDGNDAILIFKGCKTTSVSGGNTFAETIDGSVRVSSGAKNHLGWDLTVALTFQSPSFSDAGKVHQTGAIDVTSTSVNGSVFSDSTTSVTIGGSSSDSSVSEAAIFDLTISGSCVVGGTEEIKRVWIARPSGSTAKDEAVLLTFGGGCDNFTVALGT